jgi:hypothetical protein
MAAARYLPDWRKRIAFPDIAGSRIERDDIRCLNPGNRFLAAPLS